MFSDAEPVARPPVLTVSNRKPLQEKNPGCPITMPFTPMFYWTDQELRGTLLFVWSGYFFPGFSGRRPVQRVGREEN